MHTCLIQEKMHKHKTVQVTSQSVQIETVLIPQQLFVMVRFTVHLKSVLGVRQKYTLNEVAELRHSRPWLCSSQSSSSDPTLAHHVFYRAHFVRRGIVTLEHPRACWF